MTHLTTVKGSLDKTSAGTEDYITHDIFGREQQRKYVIPTGLLRLRHLLKDMLCVASTKGFEEGRVVTLHGTVYRGCCLQRNVYGGFDKSLRHCVRRMS